MVFFLLLFLYIKRLVWLNIVMLLFIVLQMSSLKPFESQIAFYSIKGKSAILFYDKQNGIPAWG
jgi:hypothetical protein